MNIESKKELIETEYFVITLQRFELEQIERNPDLLISEIAPLLHQPKQPDNLKPLKSRAAKTVKPVKAAKQIKPILHCQYCKAPFLKEGFKARHEARCIDNPANAAAA